MVTLKEKIIEITSRPSTHIVEDRVLKQKFSNYIGKPELFD